MSALLIAVTLTLSLSAARAEINGMPLKGIGPVQEIIEIASTPPMTLIVNGRGGFINDHAAMFWRIRQAGGTVKVLGACLSACTQVVSFIPRERLCFGEHSVLGFHQVKDYGGGPNIEKTRLLVARYPVDIRMWIEAMGGAEQMPGLKGRWELHPKMLWTMGYSKCEGALR